MCASVSQSNAENVYLLNLYFVFRFCVRFKAAAASSDEIFSFLLSSFPSNENTFYTLLGDEDKLTRIKHFS